MKEFLTIIRLTPGTDNGFSEHVKAKTATDAVHSLMRKYSIFFAPYAVAMELDVPHEQQECVTFFRHRYSPVPVRKAVRS